MDNPGSLCDGSYTYDRMGNVTVRDGASYGYDGMNRLSSGGGTSYTYDSIGNLTLATGTDPASYGYAQTGGVNSMLLRNITHPGSQTVTDDSTKRGWVTGVQNRYANLVWDVYGRLEGLGDLGRNGSGVQTDSYRYYPDGLRYRKDETSATGVVTTTLYLYEGNDILLKEKLEGSTWKTAQVSVRLGGMEVGRYVKDYVGTTERLEYVWQDNLGSKRAVTDTTGTVKAKIEYSVWGGSTVTAYNGYDGSQDVSYTGKDRDATGLYYFNARYYDPVAGRFYSEDPLRDGGNWFVYCGNNPLSATDPTGLFTWDEFASGVSSVGRAIGNWTIPGYRYLQAAVDSAIAGDFVDAAQYAVAAGAEAGTAAMGGAIAGKLLTKASAAFQAIAGEAAGNVAKTGPKPFGVGPHNQKIAQVAGQITNGEIIAGGQTGLPERLINTAGGLKGGRRPDILVLRADQTMYGVNVGKVSASGAPITREAQALNDLE